jgi:hypothetical protein
MNEPLVSLSRFLTGAILPNLKSVQVSQTEQIAANDRLENAIEELRLHLESQFASPLCAVDGLPRGAGSHAGDIPCDASAARTACAGYYRR